MVLFRSTVGSPGLASPILFILHVGRADALIEFDQTLLNFLLCRFQFLLEFFVSLLSVGFWSFFGFFLQSHLCQRTSPDVGCELGKMRLLGQLWRNIVLHMIDGYVVLMCWLLKASHSEWVLVLDLVVILSQFSSIFMFVLRVLFAPISRSLLSLSKLWLQFHRVNRWAAPGPRLLIITDCWSSTWNYIRPRSWSFWRYRSTRCIFSILVPRPFISGALNIQRVILMNIHLILPPERWSGSCFVKMCYLPLIFGPLSRVMDLLRNEVFATSIHSQQAFVWVDGEAVLTIWFWVYGRKVFLLLVVFLMDAL